MIFVQSSARRVLRQPVHPLAASGGLVPGALQHGGQVQGQPHHHRGHQEDQLIFSSFETLHSDDVDGREFVERQ